MEICSDFAVGDHTRCVEGKNDFEERVWVRIVSLWGINSVTLEKVLRGESKMK